MILLHQLDPVALSLGPVKVHWYGIAYAFAFIAAWWLGKQRLAKGRLPGVDANAFGDLMFYGMLGVVLGGRFGYILFYDLPTYLANPLQVLKVWEGGMSFHGGLLGVLIAAAWWSRKQRLHFFDTMDFVAPIVPLGLGFGRLANYVNGELWGKYTGRDFGVIFPTDPNLAQLGMGAMQLQAQFASGVLDRFARHPTQLYQAALEGFVLFGILWWYSRKPRRRYAVSGWFALLYGIFRFAVEFLRVPDAQLNYLAFNWLTMGQVLSVPLIIFGLSLLWLSGRAPILQPVPVEAKP